MDALHVKKTQEQQNLVVHSSVGSAYMLLAAWNIRIYVQASNKPFD